MQRPNEKKRLKITAAAARLFATRPFHEVRLDDLAAAAHVGKGTLYIYFRSKEDLYCSLIHDGMARVIEQIKQVAASDFSPPEAVEKVVARLVRFAFGHPYLYELLRAIDPVKHHESLAQLRRQLTSSIEQVFRRGAERRIWRDPHPDLTAVFIPGLVRSAVLYGPKELGEKAVTDQILRLLRHGLLKENSR